MLRGKMAIMIDPTKMMPGNQPTDIQSIIRAKKAKENENDNGDSGISGPIGAPEINEAPEGDSVSSPMSASSANDFDGSEASSGGLKHVKRAKVAGRKNKKIPTFHQDASEKRGMVLSEIRKSEQMYVMVLDSFVQVFIRPLLAEPSAYKITQTQAQQLCDDFKSITKFAGDFAKSPSFISGDDISEAFISNIDPLTKVYNHYIENFIPNILQNIHVLRSNSKFNAFLRQIQERNCIQILDTYLIPLQRIAVYELLLRKLLQNYTQDMPEYEKIEKAITLLSASSEACSKIRDHAEENAKVLTEQITLSRNGRDITLWSPERRLIRKGVLLKGKKSNNSLDTRGEQNRQVMLFTDLLLWATEPPEPVYKGHLFLTEATFDPVQENDIPSISVSVLSDEEQQQQSRRQSTASDADVDKKYTKGDGWLLSFGDKQDRDIWLDEIRRLKDELFLLPDNTELMMPLNVRSDKAKSCCTIM